jgi:hypothetical protein
VIPTGLGGPDPDAGRGSPFLSPKTRPKEGGASCPEDRLRPPGPAHLITVFRCAPPRGLSPGQTAKFCPPLAVRYRAGSQRWQSACAAGRGHTAKTAKSHGAPPVLAVRPPRPAGRPSAVPGKPRKGRPAPQGPLDRAPGPGPGAGCSLRGAGPESAPGVSPGPLNNNSLAPELGDQQGGLRQFG